MLSLLFALWMLSNSGCQGQSLYGVAPYVMRRAPVRRSAIEALERLRLPVRASHPQPIVYALPPQWTEEEEAEEVYPEEDEYANYEYESPIYRQQQPLYYARPPQTIVDYSEEFAPEPYALPRTEMFDDIRRRSEPQKNASAEAASATPTQKPQQEQKKSSGQKEEPLFRPLQNSQRTTWSTRAAEKNAIPLLKQVIQSQKQKTESDPLTEELNSLKQKKQ